jgi:hypothetical protein
MNPLLFILLSPSMLTSARGEIKLIKTRRERMRERECKREIITS